MREEVMVQGTMRTAAVAFLIMLGLLIAAPRVRAGAAPVVPVIIVSIASVQASAADQESVLSFLKHYESTLTTGRVEQIVGLYGDFDAKRRPDMEDYFREVISNLEVRLEDIRIDVTGDKATVAFERTDHFTDRRSGSPVNKSLSLARRLERQGDGWKMMLDGH